MVEVGRPSFVVVLKRREVVEVKLENINYIYIHTQGQPRALRIITNEYAALMLLTRIHFPCYITGFCF